MKKFFCPTGGPAIRLVNPTSKKVTYLPNCKPVIPIDQGLLFGITAIVNMVSILFTMKVITVYSSDYYFESSLPECDIDYIHYRPYRQVILCTCPKSVHSPLRLSQLTVPHSELLPGPFHTAQVLLA